MTSTKETTKRPSKSTAPKKATVVASAVPASGKSKRTIEPKQVADSRTVSKSAVKAATAKPAKAAKPRAKKPALVPPQQRNHYVEVAAYHIAERRGFALGDPLDDWAKAEAEIDRLLAAGLLGN